MQAVVLPGDLAQLGVERGGLAADQPDQRNPPGSNPVKSMTWLPAAAHRRDGCLEGGRQRVGVGLRPEQVVAACGYAHQVWRKPHCCRYLLADNLAEQLATDREIGVPQPRRDRRQVIGEPVGPASDCAVRTNVAYSFGEAVAKGDERPDWQDAFRRT